MEYQRKVEQKVLHSGGTHTQKKKDVKHDEGDQWRKAVNLFRKFISVFRALID